MRRAAAFILSVMIACIFTAAIAVGSSMLTLHAMTYAHFTQKSKNGHIQPLLGLKIGPFEHYIPLETD